MKRKIMLIAILLFSVAQSFAYVYYTRSFLTPKGRYSCFVKVCMAEEDNDLANKWLNIAQNTATSQESISTKTGYIFDTVILLDDGTRYYVIYFFYTSPISRGYVYVQRFDEIMYLKRGYNFNSLLAEYDDLCEEYIDLLD